MTGPVVGIVGGGQLARMLAEAATPLGIHVRVLAAPSDEGASEVVPDVVVADPDDSDALRAFARSVDVVTFDHENVDHDLLRELEGDGVVLRPSVATLEHSDKAHQRRRFSAAGIPVPDFLVLPGGSDVDADAAAAFAARHRDSGATSGDVVVKASRGGYDGRGVWILGEEQLRQFVDSWSGAPLVIEPLLRLRSELAVLVARRPSGEVVTWPVLETIQVDGMCNEVLLPAPIGEALRARAHAIGVQVAEEVEACGVVAVELFVVGAEADGAEQILVNEIAPRVHNSGHLTIEANATSQFEQHLRAILDWPLGPTDGASAAAMANVVGNGSDEPRSRQAEALAAVPGAHLHLYGKSPRAERKVGHVTVLAADVAAARRGAALVADVLAGGGTPIEEAATSTEGRS